MIKLIDLYKEYKTSKGTVVGVDRVNLEIQKGEIFGIVGYSGAGKSSLIRCINLLERPTLGSVIVNGQDMTRLNPKELRTARQKIGMIFQHFNLNASKTVFENVAFALKAAGKPKADIDRRVPELLRLVGLEDKAQQYPSQLSGGQKQRVGIARALANDPHVLLCDEATSALDPTTTKSILQLLKEINQSLNLTIVLITHQMEVVQQICHRVAVMRSGAIIEEGSTYEIFTNPQDGLTKEFIRPILQLEIPDRLLHPHSPDAKLVRIHFKGSVAEQGVVSDVLQLCQVKGNILHAKIEYIQDRPFGMFILEIDGEKNEVERAVDLLRERTSGVEVIEHGMV